MQDLVFSATGKGVLHFHQQSNTYVHMHQSWGLGVLRPPDFGGEGFRGSWGLHEILLYRIMLIMLRNMIWQDFQQ